MSSARSASAQDASNPSGTLLGLTTQEAEARFSIVATGIILPYSPLSALFGFVPVPAPFFAFLAISTVTYLALVESGKRMLRMG